MADSYDFEINQLKERLAELETKEGDGATKAVPQEMPPGGAYVELTVNALNRTIEALAHTIEELALTAEKPVDTLVRTIEVLSKSTLQGDEKKELQGVVEPPPALLSETSELPEELPEEMATRKYSRLGKVLVRVDKNTRD